MDDAKMQGVKNVQPNLKESSVKGLKICLDKKKKIVWTKKKISLDKKKNYPLY